MGCKITDYFYMIVFLFTSFNIILLDNWQVQQIQKQTPHTTKDSGVRRKSDSMEVITSP